MNDSFRTLIWINKSYNINRIRSQEKFVDSNKKYEFAYRPLIIIRRETYAYIVRMLRFLLTLDRIYYLCLKKNDTM